MKSPCDTDSCCATATACSESSADCGGAANCSDGQGCDCPIEGATKMWGASFMQAMKQAQVDVLKAKIQKAWGPMLDQAADGMMEAMGAFWAAKVAEIRSAEAKQAFQKRLRDLWLEDKKK